MNNSQKRKVSPQRRANFNNSAVSLQSWYVAGRSKALGRGKVKGLEMLGRRIVLYRDQEGVVRALDGRCAHLGANLGHGRVIGETLQCAFHHWRFGPDGHCRYAPGLDKVPKRKVRAYPVLERWGLIWLFNGPKPHFELPTPPSNKQFRVFCPPAQQINCHPHLVIANGLDTTHFEALHGMTLTEESQLIVEPPYRVTVKLRGKPLSRLLQAITGTQEREIRASFTTIGGNLAWAAIQSPVQYYVLFTAQPTPTGNCQTQLVFFLPHRIGRDFFRALTSMYVLLHDDRRILNDIQFFPGFTAKDEPLRAFAEIVNGMETW